MMLMDLKLNNVNLFGDLMKFLMVGCSQNLKIGIIFAYDSKGLRIFTIKKYFLFIFIGVGHTPWHMCEGQRTQVGVCSPTFICVWRSDLKPQGLCHKSF